MAGQCKDLWGFLLGQPHIDPEELVAAIQKQASCRPWIIARAC